MLGDIIAGVWILALISMVFYAGWLSVTSESKPDTPQLPMEPASRSVATWLAGRPILASGSERDQVVARLKRAGQEERLTPEDMEGRIDMALRARYRSRLADLVADLPEDE
jgi:hypothetical protein